MNIEVLPHHEEYEHAILGSVLAGDVQLPDITEEITFSDFYFEKHRVIFRAMEGMHGDGVPIDLVTIFQWLTDKGDIEKAGDSSYLTYLTEMSSHSPNVHYYVRAVKEMAKKRDTWFAAHEVAQAVQKERPVEEIRKLIQKLSAISEEKPPGTLRPVSASELLDLPPPKTLWADIIYPGCLIQLNAEPGIGKSTFAYNICALGALEKPFLEIDFGKRLKSLYADLETYRQQRPNKIKLIAGELPPEFHLLDELDLRRDFSDLLNLCVKEKYDLLVLDTQSRVFAMEQENDNSEANYFAGLLRRIASETGCAILLIHHSTKGEGGKAVYRGRGASAIAASVDIVLNMHTAAPDTLRLSVVKHRIQGSRPDIYMRKAGDDRFEVCGEVGVTLEQGIGMYRVQERIVEFLEGETEPVHRRLIIEDVQDMTGAKQRTIERGIEELCFQGRVTKVKRGYYMLSELAPQAPTLGFGGNGGDN